MPTSKTQAMGLFRSLIDDGNRNWVVCTSTLKSFILLAHSLHLSLRVSYPKIKYISLLVQSRDPIVFHGPGVPPIDAPLKRATKAHTTLHVTISEGGDLNHIRMAIATAIRGGAHDTHVWSS